jgi:hypothetical protein
MDINSCTITAVHAPPNTYHIIFPEISIALHCMDKPNRSSYHLYANIRVKSKTQIQWAKQTTTTTTIIIIIITITTTATTTTTTIIIIIIIIWISYKFQTLLVFLNPPNGKC